MIMEGGLAVLVSAFCKDPGGAGSIPRHFVFCCKFRKRKKEWKGVGPSRRQGVRPFVEIEETGATGAV